MLCRALKPFTNGFTGVFYRSGDTFECTEDQLDAIEHDGHYAEPVPDEEGERRLWDDPEYRQFAAMSEDELRLYADLHFKLVFHADVKKPEMIAVIMEREKGK